MQNPSKRPISLKRREFLVAAAAFSLVPRYAVARSGMRPPSDKLNIGCVGVGGMQGASDCRNVSGENIYAICDVDENFLNKAAEKYPNAKKYRDFREMLDKEYKNLDGIIITIPDHMHATVALWAMERGVAVYYQKPLAQSLWECRLLARAAEKYKVPTQMGNQGYSSIATRMACEIIWNDQIGDITEVHAMNRGGFARDINTWPDVQEVPKTLDWDLWTGRAAQHAYSSLIHPSNWRGFQEYGTQMPPVTIYWYEGRLAGRFQVPNGLTPEDVKPYNEIFVGTKGFMGTSGRGEGVSLIPQSSMKDYVKPPEVLKRSPGHFQDWIQACKGGDTACSNFGIAGPYTEWMLLGAISWRFPNEKLLWDSKRLRFTNNEKANEFIKPNFRKGWELADVTF